MFDVKANKASYMSFRNPFWLLVTELGKIWKSEACYIFSVDYIMTS